VVPYKIKQQYSGRNAGINFFIIKDK